MFGLEINDGSFARTLSLGRFIDQVGLIHRLSQVRIRNVEIPWITIAAVSNHGGRKLIEQRQASGICYLAVPDGPKFFKLLREDALRRTIALRAEIDDKT